VPLSTLTQAVAGGMTARMCESGHGNVVEQSRCSDTRCAHELPRLELHRPPAGPRPCAGRHRRRAARRDRGVLPRRGGRSGRPGRARPVRLATRTHRAAMQADRSFVWCLERFGGERAVMQTASVADECARWLDEAYRELEAARRRPSRWRHGSAPRPRARRRGARGARPRLRARGDGLQRAGRAAARVARRLSAHQFVIEAPTMCARSVSETSRGATTSSRCCFIAPSTSAGTSSSV
jgi:hypothetical protein